MLMVMLIVMLTMVMPRAGAMGTGLMAAVKAREWKLEAKDRCKRTDKRQRGDSSF